MFDPAGRQNAKNNQKAAKKATNAVKQMCLEFIPESLRTGLMIDVKEVICGDPSCAPIDTVVTLVWTDGGRGVFGIPLEPKQIKQEDLEDYIPDEDILEAWKNGQEAEWPRRPELRFQIGTRVECRTGPHPVRGWSPGSIVAQFYSEPSWPAGAFAPYQIQLDDGRLIYAPQDIDAVIRAAPSASLTSNSNNTNAANTNEDDANEENDRS